MRFALLSGVHFGFDFLPMNRFHAQYQTDAPTKAAAEPLNNSTSEPLG